ncbi:MAG: hypothetical protein JSV77_06590 [Dehalococcoidales bacterium]|nr:MAG: hypothetical protein JSV77_06590 [Dehalococcoidales bacterium]
MKRLLIVLLTLALLSGSTVITVFAQQTTVTVTVPGTACVHFAGQNQEDLEANYPPTLPIQPESGSHANFHNDTADPTLFDSKTPVVPPYIEVCDGCTLSISATGTWGHGPNLSGPAGVLGLYDATHEEYEDLGISLVVAYLNTLIGVFLTDDIPDPAATPARLDSPTTNPELQQAFVIGAGPVEVTVPDGATRLFFGLQDGYEWNNNLGSVDVEVTMICPIEVEIDIKPSSDPNSINMHSHGVLPIAILGAADFDVYTINPETANIDGIGVTTRGSAKSPKLAISYEDVNGDGLLDLIMFFNVQELVENDVLTEETTELMLQAETNDGVPIWGIDSVRIVPPE